MLRSMAAHGLMLARFAVLLCLVAFEGMLKAAPSQITRNDSSSAPDFLITAEGMAGLKLGMTLEQARRTLRGVLFERTTDGDGLALVTVTLPGGHHVVLYANEDDPDTSIDWTRRIVSIETFEPAFATADGVRVGMLIDEATAHFGAVREIIKSEIEQREYITFERQPKGLVFRIDYSGVFGNSRRTTAYEPDGKIYSLAVTEWAQ